MVYLDNSKQIFILEWKVLSKRLKHNVASDHKWRERSNLHSAGIADHTLAHDMFCQ